MGGRGGWGATGDVRRAQLCYVRGAGLEAFGLGADKDGRKAVRSLRPFTDAYQGSGDDAVPAYRRHDRAWPTASIES